MSKELFKLDCHSLRTKQKQQQQFKSMIVAIVKQWKREEILFNEFITLLAHSNIKFYSPEQFKKMNKIFNNSNNILPIRVPFEHLELHSQKNLMNQNFYLIRVQYKKDLLKNCTFPIQIDSHNSKICIRDFFILMKTRYGSEYNWFKVVGGLTVSISIEKAFFSENISQLMRNTPHARCSSTVVSLFLNDKDKVVTWDHFMKIVKENIKKIAEEVSDKKSQQFSQSKNFSNKMGTRQTRKISENNITNDNTFYNYRLDKEKSKSIYIFDKIRCKTEYSQQNSFRLTMKKCTIYSRFKTSQTLNHSKKRSLNLQSYLFNNKTVSAQDSPIEKKVQSKTSYFWRCKKGKQ